MFKIRKKIFLIGLVFLLVFSCVAYAQNYEVSQVRDVLKKNLYLYFTEPASSPLSLNEVKDLLVFYLSIPTGQTTVDCSGTGTSSNKPISTIITSGGNANDIVPTCGDGTKYGECSTTKPKFCYSGSLLDKCSSCGCPTGETCSNQVCEPSGMDCNDAMASFNNCETFCEENGFIRTSFVLGISCDCYKPGTNEKLTCDDESGPNGRLWTLTCSDSDGDDPNIKGYVDWGPITYWDECYGPQVREWICIDVDGVWEHRSVLHDCPEPCVDGVCGTTVNIICSNHLDCGTPGSVGDYYCSNKWIKKDYLNKTCINPGTVNSYCNNASYTVTYSYCNSSQGKYCVNGLGNCVSESCTDSDGGKVYSVKGTVSGYSYGLSYNYSDYCYAPGNGTSGLIEYYCNGNSYTLEPYGASNGTCVDGRWI